MAKTKTVSKNKTLRQEVTELKDSLAQLINALQPKEEQVSTRVQLEQKNTKRGRPPKSKPQADSGRGMRQGQSPHLKRITKRPATVQGIETGPRPNLFEKMVEFKSCKEDTKIDKKLWKGRKPTPRGERSTTVDVICDGCGYEFTVSPNELRNTVDENERTVSSYVCNDCIRSKH